MQISLIIFRELLEIFLLLSLITANCHDRVQKLHRYMAIGLIIGILGAILLASVTSLISTAFNGFGQEIASSIILLVVAILLATTIIYIKNYSKTLKANVNNLSNQFQNNIKHQIILVLLIASVIFREGAEIVLLIYGIILSGQFSMISIVVDILLGTSAAIFCSILLYNGLLKTAKLFKITSIFLMLVCASLVSESVGILSKSGLINILTQEAWDLSPLIPNEGLIARFLKILINNSINPSILEVLVFIITFGTILYLSNINRNKL